MKRIYLPLIVFLLIFIVAAEAREFYASPSGNNGNSGTKAQPFKTIQHGANQLSPGDTLYVRTGTYHEQVTISRSGTLGNPITIKNYNNEKPVVDGKNSIPSLKYTPLVKLSGNNIVFQGFEVKNSKGRCVQIYPGSDNKLIGINAHHCYNSGIHIQGRNALVENCQVWEACQQEMYEKFWPGGLVMVNNDSRGATIRNNKVFNNHGEGMIVLRSGNALIEGNIIYDNKKVQLYMDNANYVTIKGNLIYQTDDRKWWRNEGGTPGLILADEGYPECTPGNSAPNRGESRKIINNVIVRQGLTVWGFHEDPTGCTTGFGRIKNDIIAHNTFVNSRGSAINIGSSVTREGTNRIENNIAHGSGGFSGSNSGISFSNNLWANPQLVNPDAELVAGQVDPEWYMLKSTSPAIGKAKKISEVSDDFFGVARDSKPDMGAVEFYDGDPPTTTLGSTTTTTIGSGTTTTIGTSTTTTLEPGPRPGEPYPVEAKDCDAGLWIALNQDGMPLTAPIIRSVKNHNPLEIVAENPGKVKLLMICFKPNIKVTKTLINFQ